jgi:flavin reductase (DIM6/NTAB) family NADH-FMN oxidoreductase RutF
MARVDVAPEKWLEHPALARETYQRMANEGILLASLGADEKLNPMTIGWGVFGWIWGLPIFTVLVRPSRYTYDCIEAAGDFTVNVQRADRKDIPGLCGTLSGRDRDKMAELGLTPLPSRRITSPGIAECPIVFECKMVHKNDVLPPELTGEIKNLYYPKGDFHRIYFGRILAVSVDQELAGRPY